MVCPCVPRILKCVLSLWDSEMPHAPNWQVIVPSPRSQELVERCRLAHHPRINTKSTYPRKCTRKRTNTYTNHRSLNFHALCVRHSHFETLSQLHVGRNRRQYCYLGNQASNESLITCGIPQGSCLGQLLFSIYFNGIESCFRLSRAGMYADGTHVIVVSNNKEDLSEKAQKQLISISE